MTDFDTALQTFVDGCQAIVSKNDEQYENVKFNTKLSIDPKGRRYVRIVRTDSAGGNSVYCFVDRTNGNILKAAGWAKPAKHARGNIYNTGNGLNGMNAYGAFYLR